MLFQLVMPESISAFAESAQPFVQSGARLLLMVSMTLFMSYLLFLLGAVLISSAASRMRRMREYLQSTPSATIHAPQFSARAWDVDSAAENHGIPA